MSFSREALRFLIAGAINTGAGYLLYLVALQVLGYRTAYTVSYLLGIILSYALNTLFVFHQPWSWRALASFPLVYVLQYAVGFVLLSLLVARVGIKEEIAPLLVVVVTLPITFFASRYIIKGKRQ